MVAAVIICAVALCVTAVAVSFYVVHAYQHEVVKITNGVNELARFELAQLEEMRRCRQALEQQRIIAEDIHDMIEHIETMADEDGKVSVQNTAVVVAILRDLRNAVAGGPPSR